VSEPEFRGAVGDIAIFRCYLRLARRFNRVRGMRDDKTKALAALLQDLTTRNFAL
jgi:hypothetical protein